MRKESNACIPLMHSISLSSSQLPKTGQTHLPSIIFNNAAQKMRTRVATKTVLSCDHNSCGDTREHEKNTDNLPASPTDDYVDIICTCDGRRFNSGLVRFIDLHSQVFDFVFEHSPRLLHCLDFFSHNSSFFCQGTTQTFMCFSFVKFTL